MLGNDIPKGAMQTMQEWGPRSAKVGRHDFSHCAGLSELGFYSVFHFFPPSLMIFITVGKESDQFLFPFTSSADGFSRMISNFCDFGLRKLPMKFLGKN